MTAVAVTSATPRARNARRATAFRVFERSTAKAAPVTVRFVRLRGEKRTEVLLASDGALVRDQGSTPDDRDRASVYFEGLAVGDGLREGNALGAIDDIDAPRRYPELEDPVIRRKVVGVDFEGGQWGAERRERRARCRGRREPARRDPSWRAGARGRRRRGPRRRRSAPALRAAPRGCRENRRRVRSSLRSALSSPRARDEPHLNFLAPVRESLATGETETFRE
jgi:hypothetical protein